MTNDLIKQMFDACYQAKRVREMLPPLPKGVMPSYIQCLSAIGNLQKEQKDVCVSDISYALNLPRPGVTRTVKQMEEKGYLKKIASSEDGRIVYIDITEKGKNLSQKYDRDYFGGLSAALSNISEEEAICMIQTVEKLYNFMREKGRTL